MIPVVTLAVDGTTRVVFGGALWSTSTRSCSRASSWSPRTSSSCCRRLHRRGRLLPGRVLRPAAHVAARHDGHGVVARPGLDLRRARDDHDPGVRARRLAQARPGVNEAAMKYFLIGVFVLRGDALRHVADLRRHRSTLLSDIAAVGRAGTTSLLDGRDLPHSSASRSRSARCRSTSGRPTPTRAHPRRSPRSSRWRRRRAASSRCSASSSSASSRSAGLVAAAVLGPRGGVDDRSATWSRCGRRTSSGCSRTRRSRRAGSCSCRSRSRRDGQAARSSFEAVIIYLLIYGAMNLGAFAVVIAVARRTRSAPRSRLTPGWSSTRPGSRSR